MSSSNCIEKHTSFLLSFWKEHFLNNMYLFSKAAWDFSDNYFLCLDHYDSCRRTESPRALAPWSQTLCVTLTGVLVGTCCMAH